ncbi:hypothetical protein Q4555_13120 [Octadecabacter sp. 1_MG-2023]|uniref:hypothetical protein n=1 Tax=unclassified Octadecabacter TaxID=196158 RepID=UPI001C0A34B2|nr:MULTISPECIES: hypothetical protein [unclassified Octadecabacter]MBU2993543.1 hypothetical protein [Octadecabacter sp. B2R22]MDO6735613.1 hypothetical protein [Octadecabacter sp. 1_MG-2023]
MPLGVVNAMRSYFTQSDAVDYSASELVVRTASTVSTPDRERSGDRARYERLLEKELDQQHLTAVEREDTEMLSRVRAALYEE